METLIRNFLLSIGLLLAICIASPADAQIALNSAPGASTCASFPCTTSHTTGGVDPFLGVCVAWWHYIHDPTITSVTWNSLPLDLIQISSNLSCGNKCSAAIYVLKNPPAGTSDVTVNFSTTPSAAVVGAISFTGVDPSSATGTASTSTGSGSPASVTVSSGSGEVVLDCLSSLAVGSLPSLASGQTLNFRSFDNAGHIHGASSYISGAPSTPMVWSISGSPQWSMVGVAIKPKGGGSGSGGGGSTPGTQRIISWNDNSNNETAFHLQWRTDQSFPNWVDISTSIPANTVSYAHNIGTQTGDCYRLEATNSGGSEGFTDAVCAVDPTPPPPIPTDVSVPSPLMLDFEEDLL